MNQPTSRRPGRARPGAKGTVNAGTAQQHRTRFTVSFTDEEAALLDALRDYANQDLRSPTKQLIRLLNAYVQARKEGKTSIPLPL